MSVKYRPSVGQVSAKCRPSIGQVSAKCRRGIGDLKSYVGRHTCRSTVDRQSIDSRSTLDRQSIDCRPLSRQGGYKGVINPYIRGLKIYKSIRSEVINHYIRGSCVNPSFRGYKPLHLGVVINR